MKRFVVLAALICIVALMAVAAWRLGPPAGPAPAPPPPPATPLPNQATAAPASVTIRSFGPAPGCRDDLAVGAVVAALRKQGAGSTLGLADVRVLGHSQVGAVSQVECDAQVQQTRGERRVRYQITPIVSDHETWELTIDLH